MWKGFQSSREHGFGRAKYVFGDVFGKMPERRFSGMRKKGFKGRCEKRKLAKCREVCRTYDPIQAAYAEVLQANDEVREIQCNVPLDDGEHMTDFLCEKTDGEMMVRECVQRKHLLKPMTIRLLDASRTYWAKHGVADWGLVVDADEE